MKRIIVGFITIMVILSISLKAFALVLNYNQTSYAFGVAAESLAAGRAFTFETTAQEILAGNVTVVRDSVPFQLGDIIHAYALALNAKSEELGLAEGVKIDDTTAENILDTILNPKGLTPDALENLARTLGVLPDTHTKSVRALQPIVRKGVMKLIDTKGHIMIEEFRKDSTTSIEPTIRGRIIDGLN